MKFLGVSGVFDYAGPNRSSRYRACSYCLPHITRASASGLTVYGAEYPPRLSSVYASLGASRYPAQDSRPSGSLLLSRKALSSFTPCRFSPAHCKGLFTTGIWTIAALPIGFANMLNKSKSLSRLLASSCSEFGQNPSPQQSFFVRPVLNRSSDCLFTICLHPVNLRDCLSG